MKNIQGNRDRCAKIVNAQKHFFADLKRYLSVLVFNYFLRCPLYQLAVATCPITLTTLRTLKMMVTTLELPMVLAFGYKYRLVDSQPVTSSRLS